MSVHIIQKIVPPLRVAKARVWLFQHKSRCHVSDFRLPTCLLHQRNARQDYPLACHSMNGYAPFKHLL